MMTAGPELGVAVGGVVSGVVCLWVADQVPTSRPGALLAMVVALPVTISVFALVMGVLGGRPLRSLIHWDA